MVFIPTRPAVEAVQSKVMTLLLLVRCLLIRSHCVCGFVFGARFVIILCVLFSFAIISLRNRETVT